MIDFLELLLTACLWSTHLAMLVGIAYLTKGKPAELKVATILFLFYSLGALLSFEFDFFQYRVRYAPAAVTLLAYVVADVLFLLASLYLYGGTWQERFDSAALRDDTRPGNIALVVLAVVAQFINVYFNWEYLLLPKSEYIAEAGQSLTPNLLFLSIPAESILVGSILINPFRSRLPRWTVTALGIATLLLSAFQGYRHLVMLLLLLAVLRRYRTLGGPALIAITLVLTLAGELSNVLKMSFYQSLLDPEFDQLSYLQWYVHSVEWLPISSEQAAIAANFKLGMPVMQAGSDLIQLIRLLPFTTSLVDNVQTTVDLIGKAVGIGHGQGTAYNLQLFLLNTVFLGGVFVFVVLFLVRTVRSSVLLIYGLEIFYSLMRNGPSFWVGQIKMLLILMMFGYAFNATYRFLRQHRVVDAKCLGGEDC